MKRKLWLILIPVLVTVICGTLSFLAGHYVPWTPLGTPPEPAVEILRATSGGVVVQTTAGSFYRCAYTFPYPQDVPPPRGCTWEEIETAPTGSGVPETDEWCSFLLPPGRIADRFYFCSNPHWRYLVLTNGSVWTYYNNGDGPIAYLNDARFVLCFPLGIFVSLLLGVTAYSLLRWRRRRAT